MADFPEIDAADPSAEEEKANQRSLTLGLIAGGLGILAQPRWRGESKIAPVARGALGGLNAYEGSMADSADQRYRNRQQQIEQQRYAGEREDKQTELGYEKQRVGIEQQNADTNEKARTRMTAPAGPLGIKQAQAYRDNDVTAPIWGGLSDDDIAALPYEEFKDRMNSSELTRRASMNPQLAVGQPVQQPDGTWAIPVTDKRNTTSSLIPLHGTPKGEVAKPPTAAQNAETIAKLTKAYKDTHPQPFASGMRPGAMAEWNKGLSEYLKANGADPTAPARGALAGDAAAGISVGTPAKKSDGTVLSDGPHKTPSGVQFVVKDGKVVSVGASPALAMSSDAHGPTLPPTAAPSGPPLPPPPAPAAAPAMAGPAPMPPAAAPMPARAPVAPPAAAKPLPMHAKLGKTGKPLKDGSGNYAFTDGKFLYKAKSPAGPFIPLGPDPDAAKGA